MPDIRTTLRAFFQLGPLQTGDYALYKVLLHSGYLRRQTPGGPVVLEEDKTARLDTAFFPIPSRDVLRQKLGPAGLEKLVEAADEICAGQVRLFGGPPVPLSLTPPGPLKHWSEYELGRQPWGVEDVKWIWEPARFGWAYTLARAAYLTGADRFAQVFWEYTQTFLDANPPNMGPNWASAQEVALRLIALAFCGQVLAPFPSSTPERMQCLASAVAAHARRIPPTLLYARAQNNNHLLSEAAGLFTAALALPGHPQASLWRRLGWHWFHRGIERQITPDGAYSQHSSNYHRLMLQISLWVQLIAQPEQMPAGTLQRLAQAARWLGTLLDPTSGHAPNLGPNDGAYIFPLTLQPFEDYRPVVQAAGIAFLNNPLAGADYWDEMVEWLAGPQLAALDNHEHAVDAEGFDQAGRSPIVLRSPDSNSWAYLRAASFHGRPGHADQLHLDLWWQGENIALDPGTYLYNAPQPWDNALCHAAVHNTVTVDGKDQMTRAGRFLYLDWARAQVLTREQADDGSWERVSAEHDGYRRLGLVHRRTVTCRAHEWIVDDWLLPAGGKRSARHQMELHWQLPDRPWKIEHDSGLIRLQVSFPAGLAVLEISMLDSEEAGPSVHSADKQAAPHLQVIRAGKIIHGHGTAPETWGWFSPVYGQRRPARAILVSCTGVAPLGLRSRWILTPSKEGTAL